MSPNEAEKEKNYKVVREWMSVKRIEFNKTQGGKLDATLLKVGQPVLVKREVGLKKGKSRYNRRGIVHSLLLNDTYNILINGVLYKDIMISLKYLLTADNYFAAEM